MTRAHCAKTFSAELRAIPLLSTIVVTIYGCSGSQSSYDLPSMLGQAQKATPVPDPTGNFRTIKSLDIAGISRNAVFQRPPRRLRIA